MIGLADTFSCKDPEPCEGCLLPDDPDPGLRCAVVPQQFKGGRMARILEHQFYVACDTSANNGGEPHRFAIASFYEPYGVVKVTIEVNYDGMRDWEMQDLALQARTGDSAAALRLLQMMGGKP